MDPSTISLLFGYIRDEWIAIPSRFMPPWGVWITQHPPLPPDARDIPNLTYSIQRAWFMQAPDRAPQPRSVWEYIRLVIVHFEQPWNAFDIPVPDERFQGPCYPIGFAHFAPFIDSQDLCLEIVWGGRWGRGRRLRQTTPDVLTPIQEFWVS